LYRGISDLKKGYQPVTNIVKDEKCDLVTDCDSIWADGGNIPFSFSMNMTLMILGRQTDIHTAEPLVSEPSASEFEMNIEK